MLKSLCFVLMPFGKKPGVDGLHIDSDVVYHELIRPSIEKSPASVTSPDVTNIPE